MSTIHGFIRTITRVIVNPGSVTYALMPLRMARKLDPCRETARMALEPWLVEAALARLRETLSPADQRTIVKATRTPTRSNGRSGGANTPDIERTSPASPVRRRAAELGGFNSPAFSRLPILHGILGNRNKLFEQGASTHSSDERARLNPPVQTASLATFGGGVLTDLLAGLAANSRGLAKSFFRTREFRRDGLSYPLQAHSICLDEVFRFNYERPLCARSRHLATDRLLYLCLSVRRLTPFFEVNRQFGPRRPAAQSSKRSSLPRGAIVVARGRGIAARDDAASAGAARSNESRSTLDLSSTRSMKTSACRRSSSAIIGGWLEMVEITVTRTPRRCTASTSERKSPSPENNTI